MENNTMIVPKGTRIKIGGCPFVLSQDVEVENNSLDNQNMLRIALADERKWNAEKDNPPLYSDFNLPPVQYAIIKEINQAVVDLGGGVGILCILGSWGDTLPQDEILEMFRDYNKAVKEEGWITQPAIFASKPLQHQ